MTRESLDVWGALGIDSDPEDIYMNVHLNVRKLLRRLDWSNPCSIIQVGRKTGHLISHYKNHIMDAGFQMSQIRKNILKQKYVGPIPHGEEAVLIVDSIHTGREIASILEHLTNNDVRVRKILSYLTAKEGEEFIIRKGIVDKEKIVTQFSSADEDEYKDEYKRLLVFYFNRIEPMDQSVPYNHYYVTDKPDLRTMRGILEESARNALSGSLSILRTQSKALVRGIQIWEGTSSKVERAKELVYPHFDSTFDYKLDEVSIRAKTMDQRIGREIIITIDTKTDCVPPSDYADTCCLVDRSSCRLYDEGESLGEPDDCCPQCVNAAISSYLLDHYHMYFKRSCEAVGIIPDEILPYRPFNRVDPS